MEEALTDPLDVSKDSELIKDAQKDLSKVDVLVCGGCHEVYHFIEELQEHKSSNQCTGTTSLKCENEEKSQIWGFSLWKSKQARIHKSRNEELPSSWETYQKWTKLDQLEKDLWISAGRTLQFCSKIANSRVKEVRDERKIEKDPLAIDEGFTTLESESNDIKTGILKSVKIPFQGTKKALRTSNDNEKEEYIVERIVGKRFNPRKRIWEYEVKWENYKDETWEPLSHLENCKALVQEYEDKIKAEKEKEKEKQTPRGRGRPRLNPLSPSTPVKIVQKKPVITPTTATVVLATTPGGRPQRTSKQKALNQVKAWCGNISDEETGTKRSHDDDDGSDDSFEKRIKLEGDSEDTDEDEPKLPVKKVAKIIHTYNNGAGRRLPDNVLIPDAKGVVRISQKQLPSLSSGVYIMSKSSGIIKLDPTASRIATSGGQAIVKVSPKIGQTQIRIIKKEDGSKRVVQVKGPEAITTATTTAAIPQTVRPQKIVHQVITKPTIVKKEPEKVVKKFESSPRPIAPKLVVKEKEEPKFSIANDEESDDGVEELEFPTDLPLPEPESPPGEFTLDPFTGKVVGQEYLDPEPEPVINETKKESPTETIDNIVKLAAADITEEDLKPDTEPITVPEDNTPTTTITTTTVVTPVPIVTTAIIVPTTSAVKETVFAVVTDEKIGQSILNTAIANSNILQKTLQAPLPSSKPKTQPRIINQAVAKPRTSMSPLVRTSSSPKTNLIRPKQHILPKPKFNIAPMNPAASVRNVYSKTNVTKKIGNTTVYKGVKPATSQVQPSVKRIPQKVNTPIVPKTVVSVPKPAVSVPKPVVSVPKPVVSVPKPVVSTPKPVISMPSLDEDTTPVVVTPKVTQVATETPVATVEADLSTFTLASADRPMFITGDDGTVYQVAGQNEDGQTILLTQDSDGQQQCLLVTNEAIQEEEEQVENPGQMMMEVQEPVDVSEEQPLVAQFIRTEPPSPGGTHKVVVMLPDGDVMVTQVTPEEYASLELDK